MERERGSVRESTLDGLPGRIYAFSHRVLNPVPYGSAIAPGGALVAVSLTLTLFK